MRMEAAVLWSNRAECLLRVRLQPERHDDGASTAAADHCNAASGGGSGCLAREACERALRLWPQHRESQVRLGYCHHRQRQDMRQRQCGGDSDDGYDDPLAGGGSLPCSGWAAARGTSGCCEIDDAFFGAERTAGTALAQLSGELHGAATELEAALALLSSSASAAAAAAAADDDDDEEEHSQQRCAAAVARAVQGLWQHADARTPRERAMGWGAVGLNVAVPNPPVAEGGGLLGAEATAVYQELDLVYSTGNGSWCGSGGGGGSAKGERWCAEGWQRPGQVWCEVKAWTSLVRQAGRQAGRQAS